jgi:hypothetical protein
MTIEYKTFTAEVKAFDDTNLTVEHFISTEHKDRGGDIMRAKGMKIVGKPVVLMLHGRGPMGSEPIAKPLSITVDEFKGEPGILAKTQFFADETGQRLYQKIKGGFIPNWSIGYMVDEAKDLLRDGNYDGRDVTKWQLLEYSPVGVPMNPFAQTIKEFLDADDAGKRPEIKEEPRWFGFVDAKDCKDCGQGCEKHGKPPEIPSPDPAAQIAALEAEATKHREALVLAGEAIVAAGKRFDELEATLASMKTTADSLTDSFKKLEPLLESPPPAPEGGGKGEGDPPDNPPEEKKTPPRLVIVREEDTPQAKNRAAILAIAKEAVNEVAKQEIDRIRGRVP